ncbi:MAG: GNAT family N-acetyltransferase [Actinomycetota bacterium]
MTIDIRPVEPGDLPRLAEVFAAAFAAHGHTVVTTAEELAEEFQPPHCDPRTDAVVAVENGRIFGGAHTIFLPSTEREVRCYLEGKVDPASTGRGAGSALLDWSLGRAFELLSAETALPRVIRVSVLEDDLALPSLLSARGFRAVRWFSTLLRPLGDPPEAGDPEGIRIAPWDPARSVDALGVNNVAFADHWGSAPMQPEGWTQNTTGFGSHPATSFMAFDDDRVVAFLTSHRYDVDDEAVGKTIGWVDHLGTLPTHRRRGIASALITRALGAYRAEGWTHAAIEVDNDNPTGARGLYGSLGFAPWRGSVTWERRL